MCTEVYYIRFFFLYRCFSRIPLILFSCLCRGAAPVLGSPLVLVNTNLYSLSSWLGFVISEAIFTFEMHAMTSFLFPLGDVTSTSRAISTICLYNLYLHFSSSSTHKFSAINRRYFRLRTGCTKLLSVSRDVGRVVYFSSLFIFSFFFYPGLPLWSSGQSSWLQIQRPRVRFPALPDFLRSSGSRTGSNQPREDD
jgi:hypothetical protein